MQRDSVHCSLGQLGFAVRLVNSQGSKFTFMFSHLGVTTRLGLVAHGIFWWSKSTSWPASIQGSKAPRQPTLSTVLLVFHRKMRLNCFLFFFIP